MLVLNRRRSLSLLGAAGATALWQSASRGLAQAAGTFACVPAPAQTEGPYFVEEGLNRADIRVDPSAGSIRPGKKYLRGYQVTDNNGAVNSTTIYPGWYSGRTIHIHFKVRT